MRKLLARISAVFDRIIDGSAFLAGVLVILLMLVVAVDTALRYFLGRPIEGALEFAEYTLLFITLLGAAWLLKVEGHVAMDLVLNRLGSRTQTVLSVATSILGGIICLSLLRYTAQDTWMTFQGGEYFPTLLMIPKAPILAVLPVGFFLLFIQFLRRAYRNLGNLKVQDQN